MDAMIRITYLLSERFDYGTTIHADAGPGYAIRQKWTADQLSRLREVAAIGPALIDNRITDPEMAEVSRLIPMLDRYPIYIKVVDPYWEHIRQPYYQWLLGLTRFPNVCFVGPYHATGLTALLQNLSRPDAYLHVPYAYEIAKESPLGTAGRTRFLAFAGAVHPDFYPERSAMLRAIRRHWWAARRINVLPHPGYPDIGQAARHAVTGEHFVGFLASHRFMYLEPSRDNLEFLKYTECAYAGCVPVGRAPATFPDELRELVLPLESRSLRQDLRRLGAMSPEACSNAARWYRDRLKQIRDPDRLNDGLCAHYQEFVKKLAAS